MKLFRKFVQMNLPILGGFLAGVSSSDLSIAGAVVQIIAVKMSCAWPSLFCESFASVNPRSRRTGRI